jgi:PHD/YefM family antitoxin component YafN of YafNO toxin-antitoxin module
MTLNNQPAERLEGIYMIDSLDRQILEVIEKAPSIVRSITEREIERGVLFPSVSTMDIKRNLSYDVSIEVIEGRLNSLESEGYIYFEQKRWWLTHKGRIVLGRSDEKTALPTPSSRSMRKILEETFSRFEVSNRDSLTLRRHPPDFAELVDERSKVEALLSELKQGVAAGLISKDEYAQMAERITTKLKDLDVQIETHVSSRRSSLLREITDLEEALAKKKAELDRLNRVSS